MLLDILLRLMVLYFASELCCFELVLSFAMRLVPLLYSIGALSNRVLSVIWVGAHLFKIIKKF